MKMIRAARMSAFVALCGAVCALSQTATGFLLAGVMVKAGTNQPLNHVLVTIGNLQHHDWHASYITDTDGRFVFQNLPAGKWNLSAEKNGYPMEPFQGYEGYSTAVAVGPGIDTTHILFPLYPSGILSGTVVDDQGDPVRQAQVFLFRHGVVSGRLITQNAGQQQTDSAGEFSFGSLQPGNYYVAVSARPWYARNFRAGTGMMTLNGRIVLMGQSSSENVQHDERDVAYPVTYYGDVTDSAAAEPVTVQEGNESRIRIAMGAVPAWRITIPTASGHGAQIETLGPGGLPIPFPAQYTVREDAMEILGVPSGRYVMRLFGKANFSKIVDIAGDQTVEFSDSPRFTLSGHVKWDGAVRPPDQAFIELVSESGANSVGGRVQTDGSFQYEPNTGPAPGRYRISLNGAPGFAIKSIQAKGARYADGVLDVTGSESIDLSIIATSNLAKINGVAVRDNAPCPAAMILLLPADGDPDNIRRDQSDSDGTFTLADVLPGRYTLVAIDNGRELAYQDPTVMAKYLAQGQVIDVPLKSQSPLTVPVQTR